MNRADIESQLILRAREDAVFRQRLLDDPRGTVGEILADDLPHDVEVAVFEETPGRLFLVLPAVRDGELDDADLAGVAGGGSDPSDAEKKEPRDRKSLPPK